MVESEISLDSWEVGYIIKQTKKHVDSTKWVIENKNPENAEALEHTVILAEKLLEKLDRKKGELEVKKELESRRENSFRMPQ